SILTELPPPRTYSLSLPDALPISQQQLREVHDARARARGLVRGVEPDQLTARRIVLVLELPRAAAFVLVGIDEPLHLARHPARLDRKSTRLNSSHQINSYPIFCLK